VREDRNTGKPKGFAFVTFEEEASTTRALAEMQGYKYGDRPLTVSRATARGGKKEADAPVVAWKTVPTSKPLPTKKAAGDANNDKTGDGTEKTGKKKNNKKKGAAKDENKGPKSWDHWAGPG
jgi:RNA recognition motif-containing protein